jgi:hypothetical protein
VSPTNINWLQTCIHGGHGPGRHTITGAHLTVDEISTEWVGSDFDFLIKYSLILPPLRKINLNFPIQRYLRSPGPIREAVAANSFHSAGIHIFHGACLLHPLQDGERLPGVIVRGNNRPDPMFGPCLVHGAPHGAIQSESRVDSRENRYILMPKHGFDKHL